MNYEPKVVINYGGGTNSTALIVEAVKRGLPFHLIVFSDTGSERPNTYEYLNIMNTFLARHDRPLIEIVRWVRVQGKYPGRFLSLHQWCELENTVPSRAFGFSGCTNKWKQQPADKFIKAHRDIEAEHATGKLVERWIGYDADEPSRADRMFAKNPERELWKWRAPLIEWDMGRDECAASINSAGLPQPGKSSCWMCPSMTLKEIDDLGVEHPELLERALAMEKAADFRSRAGLGGRLNWNEYVATKRHHLTVVDVPETSFEMACGCYDGEP